MKVGAINLPPEGAAERRTWVNILVLEFSFGRRFEHGDKSALLEAIQWCAMFDHPLPRWVADAFQTAYFSVKYGEHLSWDNVFGAPHPKNAKAHAKGEPLKRWRVWSRVCELRQQKPRRDVFPQVAQEFTISAALARKWFYDQEKR